MAAPSAHAQLKVFRMEKDSIPLFRGFQVSFDLVGAARLMFGDRGEIGGGLRVNLHDQWFPVVEFGIGKANHNADEPTYIAYKTTAPYFRVGIDINLLKNKHQSNRLYGGIRYGFTSYKVDITPPSGMGCALQASPQPQGGRHRTIVVCTGLWCQRPEQHRTQFQCHH